MTRAVTPTLRSQLERNLAELQLERLRNPGIDQSAWIREVAELAQIVTLEEFSDEHCHQEIPRKVGGDNSGHNIVTLYVTRKVSVSSNRPN